jgi:hypothetical protein
MSDSTISALNSASLPLTGEAVPCVQSMQNRQAPAAAFGIPRVGRVPTTPGLAEYQTWIDDTQTPPRLYMFINGAWIELYRIADDGTLTITKPLLLANDPESGLEYATQQYVDTATRTPVVNGVILQNTQDCSANPNYPEGKVGDLYVVIEAGKIGGDAGVDVQIGDMFICCLAADPGNQAGVGSSWNVIQGKVQNLVVGPGTAADGRFAQFDGTSGALIKDGGVSLDTDLTMAANSDSRVPSQKAVKGQLGGKPLASDTPAQGQVWMWDVPSASYRVGDCEGHNLLVNPSFDVWQENGSYTLSPTVTKTHIADFWKVGGGSTGGRIVSATSNWAKNGNAVSFLRPAGFMDTGRFHLMQQFESGWPLAGNSVMVSFDLAVGANYSPTTGPYVTIYWGTSLGSIPDPDLRLTSPSYGSNYGSISSASLDAQVAPYGSHSRIVAGPFTVPTSFSRSVPLNSVAFDISSGDFNGTAGADDSFTIGDVKLEIGTVATPFRRPDPVEMLRVCRRRYHTTFVDSPAGGTGNDTGELMFRRFRAGTMVEGAYVPLPGRMRVAPSVTLFNPIVGNNQVRNITANADCSASAVDYGTDRGFRITCTGNTGGAVGDWLTVHYVADARL